MNIDELIFGFVNSKDIATHLKEIGYRFSAPEAGYLAYQSKKRTLNEMIDAFEKIIGNMPD